MCVRISLSLQLQQQQQPMENHLTNPPFEGSLFGSCRDVDGLPMQHGLDVGGWLQGGICERNILPSVPVTATSAARGTITVRDWHTDEEDGDESGTQGGSYHYSEKNGRRRKVIEITIIIMQMLLLGRPQQQNHIPQK